MTYELRSNTAVIKKFFLKRARRWEVGGVSLAGAKQVAGWEGAYPGRPSVSLLHFSRLYFLKRLCWSITRGLLKLVYSAFSDITLIAYNQPR